MTGADPLGPAAREVAAPAPTGEAGSGSAGGAVATALARLAALARQPVPADLAEWAARCHTGDGFPLLGTSSAAEPYVALQWNGERADRAGLTMVDLVVLTGLVTAWQHDRSVADLQVAVSRAIAGEVPTAPHTATTSAPVTAGVVTTALCAGVLSGLTDEELPALVDVAGTLMQVRPPTAETAQGHGSAAGHTAAAGWLACRVHLAGLTAYDGALLDTLTTAELPAGGPDPATPVRQLVEDLR